jgi:hypothetical protein
VRQAAEAALTKKRLVEVAWKRVWFADKQEKLPQELRRSHLK